MRTGSGTSSSLVQPPVKGSSRRCTERRERADNDTERMKEKNRVLVTAIYEHLPCGLHKQRVTVVNGVSQLESKHGVSLEDSGEYFEWPDSSRVPGFYENAVAVHWVSTGIHRDRRSNGFYPVLPDHHRLASRRSRESTKHTPHRSIPIGEFHLVTLICGCSALVVPNIRAQRSSFRCTKNSGFFRRATSFPL